MTMTKTDRWIAKHNAELASERERLVSEITARQPQIDADKLRAVQGNMRLVEILNACKMLESLAK